MPASWRREDMGYAAAAAGAVAFLAYLVFGNFGLVPSPLATAATDDQVLVATQAVQSIQDSFDEDVSTPVQRPVDPAPQTDPVPVPPKPPAARDDVAPVASIATASGTKVTLTEAASVEGTATDGGSGVDTIKVTFTPQSGSPQTVPATLDCSGSGSSCTWAADIPSVVGQYTVTATVTDREGNTGKSDPIDVTVVNVGSTVENITEPVREAPSTIGNIVGGLLGGL